MVMRKEAETIVIFLREFDFRRLKKDIKPKALMIWGAGIIIFSRPKFAIPVIEAPSGTINIQAINILA